MPSIRIDMFEGRTPEQKRALVKGLTKVVVEVLNVSSEVVSVQIVEGSRENFAVAGVLATDR